MASLYVTEQGATVSREGNRIVVTSGGAALAEVHDFKLERVVIVGNVQVTTQALSLLLDRGVETSFLSVRGRLKGRLAPLESKNAPLRVRQYGRAGDAAFSLGVARAIVAGKVANCSAVLSRHRRNHPESGLEGAIARLAEAEAKASRAATRDALLGVEGAAAAAYFEGFARMLRRGLGFAKRTRRPPRDPVNALLSFGYTLLYGEAIGAAAAAGFDPYIGYYHAVDYGRCSLALDLIEELRPLAVDRLVVSLINREVLTARDFEPADGGIHLGDGARRRFFREYERAMTGEFAGGPRGERVTVRGVLRAQAGAMRRAVVHGVAYAPFRGWR